MRALRLGTWLVALAVALSAVVALSRPAPAVRAATVPSCPSVSLATDLPSPQTVGATVNVSALFTGCPDGPLYRWWVRYPDGVWRIVQDYSAHSLSWPTAGLAPGTYQLGVWVKDTLSTNSYDIYALMTYQLTDPSCTAASVASNQGPGVAAGTTFTFTATAFDCLSPLYEWWIRDTSGTWSVPQGQDFAHAGATFTWATTGLPGGTYQVGVWVRDQHSSKQYDAYSTSTYTLLAPGTTGCSYLGLNTDVGPTFGGGGTVTLSAAGGGCSNPVYMFWLRGPSGSWTILQGYGFPSLPGGPATYTWSTRFVAPGTYLLGAWAKSWPPGGDPANFGALTFDVYAITTITILPRPACTAVSLTPSVVSPEVPGISVAFNPSVSGCDLSEFQYFVAAPGAGFVEKQPYGAGTTFTWATTGLPRGVYQIGVWARTPGSGTAYETYGIVSYQLA